MSTVLTYGDVTIGRVLTQTIDQQPQYDDSGTDLLFWRYTVRVSGFLQSSYNRCEHISVNNSGANLANRPEADAVSIHIAARSKLPPRQRFSLSMDGEVLLTAEPAIDGQQGDTAQISGRDVDAGPKCQQFVVTQVSGRNVFRVDAVFEICKVECDASGQALGNTKGVLSHRWSATDSIDRNKRVTRTTTGTLRTAGYRNPHMFRSLVVPPLQPYLRRDQMQFTATADGKSLQYTITDQEVAVGAPLPLTSWDIQHTESLDEGMAGRGSLIVTMEGDTEVDKTEMLEVGFWLLYGQLYRSTPRTAFEQNADPTIILEQIAITDHIGEVNRLQLQATVRRVPTAVNPNGDLPVGVFRANAIVPVTSANLPGFAGNPADTTPGNGANGGNIYSPTKNPGNRFGEIPYIEGPVELVGLFVAYLQTPCNDSHANGRLSLQFDTNGDPTNSPQADSIVVVPSLPSTSNNPLLSESHRESMYTHYRMVSLPNERAMVAVMPIANAVYGGSGNPPDACKIIRLADLQARRVVRIHAERIGEWPELPDAATLPSHSGFSGSTGIVHTLLKAKREVETPDITASGQKLYRVRFDATYALSRAAKKDEPLPVGRNPWTTEGQIHTNTTATDGWA